MLSLANQLGSSPCRCGRCRSGRSGGPHGTPCSRWSSQWQWGQGIPSIDDCLGIGSSMNCWIIPLCCKDIEVKVNKIGFWFTLELALALEAVVAGFSLDSPHQVKNDLGTWNYRGQTCCKPNKDQKNLCTDRLCLWHLWIYHQKIFLWNLKWWWWRWPWNMWNSFSIHGLGGKLPSCSPSFPHSLSGLTQGFLRFSHPSMCLVVLNHPPREVEHSHR